MRIWKGDKVCVDGKTGREWWIKAVLKVCHGRTRKISLYDRKITTVKTQILEAWLIIKIIWDNNSSECWWTGRSSVVLKYNIKKHPLR
jgi:hypothetical protein